MSATAFAPGAFYSAAFLQFGGSTGVFGRRGKGGDDAFKRRHFDDIEQRRKLRELIEAQFAEPEIQQAIAPYILPSAHPKLRPKFDWDQIAQNFESLEHFLRVFEQNKALLRKAEDDDESDLLELL